MKLQKIWKVIGIMGLFGVPFFSLGKAGVTNHAFYTVRPQTVNDAMRLSTWHKVMRRKLDPLGGASFAFTPFYQASVNREGLARYFMFDFKDSLSVATLTNNPNADVDPSRVSSFNLRSAYQGTFSFRPSQQVIGSRIDYYQNLAKLKDGLYFAAQTALINVRNDMDLDEQVISLGAPFAGPSTITESFAGHQRSADYAQNWEFGLINGAQDTTQLADIDLKLGYHLMDQQKGQLGIYAGLTIPTGNKAKAIYVFEPIAGNGGHVGLGGGLDAQLSVWKSENNTHEFILIFNIDYRYLLQSTETRTLELKGKNWGRYIRMRKQDPNDPTQVLINAYPGVNVMTRRVNVTPGSQFEILAAASYCLSHLIFDVGCDFFAKQSEDVHLKDDWNAPGVFGLIAPTAPFDTNTGTLPAGPALTAVASNTTINGNGTADGIFLTSDDVDSNGSPSTASFKLFTAIGYEIRGKAPVLLGFGGSYEFGDCNSNLEQWSIWAKFGISV